MTELPEHIRRLVITLDPQGQSVVESDEQRDFDGSSTQLWATDRAGSGDHGSGGHGEGAARAVEATPGGSTFELVTIRPEDDRRDERSSTKRSSRPAAGKAERFGRQTLPFHPMSALSYATVLEGEVTLVLDTGAITLRRFDTVVLQGATHRWDNRGAGTACLALVHLHSSPCSAEALSEVAQGLEAMSPDPREPDEVPTTPRRRRGANIESTISVDSIVSTAVDILDEFGTEKLTTTELARRLHISQPSLYSHVKGLPDIRARVALHGMNELSRRVEVATRDLSGEQAVTAMAHAYRRFVQEHPQLYLLQCQASSTGDSDEFRAQAERAAEAVRLVLRSCGVQEPDIVRAHQVFRAGVHGFVHLEANGAIAAGTDRGFDFFVRLYLSGLGALRDDPS